MSFDREFLLSDVMEIIGIKKTSLENWIGFGYVGPSIQKATGTGSRNIFSLEDLCEIGLFKRLVDRGFSREEAAKFANAPLYSGGSASKFDLYLKMWNLHPYAPIYVAFIREEGKVKMLPVGSEGFENLKRNLSKADDCYIVNIKEMISEICFKAGVRPEGTKGDGKTLLTKAMKKKGGQPK